MTNGAKQGLALVPTLYSVLPPTQFSMMFSALLAYAFQMVTMVYQLGIASMGSFSPKRVAS